MKLRSYKKDDLSMDSEQLNRNWSDVCAKIKSYDDVDPAQIDAFFSRLEPQAMSEGFLMLTADTAFIKQWVEKHYLDSIKSALEDLFQLPFTVSIEIDESNSAYAHDPQNAPGDGAAAQAGTSAVGGAAATAQAGATTGGADAVVAASASNVSRETFASDGRDVAETGTRGASATEGAKPATTPAADADARAKVFSAPAALRETPLSADASATRTADGTSGTQRADATSVTAEATLSTEKPLSTFTFENFVIGDSNRMAYSMAVNVAETPGETPLNPLFIYGKSGLGKTHLMRAIQNYIYETQPDLKTVYVDSAELLSDYMDAAAAHDKEKSSYKNFKTHYEEADILLIDDIQYLQGRKQTLDIVFQIFNKLIDRKHQIVLSADRAPKNIDIDERYYSRFSQGGTVDIQPPEIETKLGIIKAFIEEYRRNEGLEDFSMPEEIQMYIAENSSSNIRELKSAVTKIVYRMSFSSETPLTIDDVRILLENHFSGGNSKTLTIEDVQKEVENFYKVRHSDLVGSKRARSIVYPRQIAIYLCRQLLDLPFNDIGKKFNRDHSTIMHSVASVEEMSRTNREVQEEIDTLRQIIHEL